MIKEFNSLRALIGSSWFSDGSKTSFHTYNREGDLEIYAMNADGSNLRRIGRDQN